MIFSPGLLVSSSALSAFVKTNMVLFPSGSTLLTVSVTRLSSASTDPSCCFIFFVNFIKFEKVRVQ